MNPRIELRNQGQSIWLDYISRSMIKTGRLRSLVENDGLRGVTSNPSIFEKAIDDGTDYDTDLAKLIERGPRSGAKQFYDELAIEDLRNAADVLRPEFYSSGGADGSCSLEPPPQLTGDTSSILAEVRRLWKAVGRLNLKIKIVATPDGVTAVETLISEGITSISH